MELIKSSTWDSSGEEEVSLSLKFNTKYEDETGLTYYNNRYYSKSQGRFISRDPIYEEGGLNLYAFVDNDPINHWDFLGLFVVNDAFEDAYPHASDLLAHLSSKTTKTEYDAFMEYGQANQMQVNTGLGYGTGPTINPTTTNSKGKSYSNDESSYDYGDFRPSSPNTININQDLLQKTNSTNPTKRAEALAVLEATLKHELVHYFDYQDGEDYEGEEGDQFERAVWGNSVEWSNVAQILVTFPNLGVLKL